MTPHRRDVVQGPRGDADPRVTIIDGSASGLRRVLTELWQTRSLGGLLVWRDVKVRYRQAAFGVAWAVLRPLAMMVILTIVFGRLVRFPTGGVDYASFVLAGIVAWNLFASTVSQASESVVKAGSLVTKVYFPRLHLPLSSLGVPLLDLAVGGAILTVIVLLQGTAVSARWLLAPLPVLLALSSATAPGLWLAALNARYRDVPHIVPFVLQALFFATPIVYPATIVPAQYRGLYFLNPMATAVEWFRWTLFGGTHPDLRATLPALLLVVVGLVGAMWYFNREAREFADVI